MLYWAQHPWVRASCPVLLLGLVSILYVDRSMCSPGREVKSISHCGSQLNYLKQGPGSPLVLRHWAQISPCTLISPFSPLCAVRGGRVWGKCPAGYFCPAGTSELTTQGPRESQPSCPQGQLCAKQCPPGNDLCFLPLECERGREQGCLAATTAPTRAKDFLFGSKTDPENS